jgi:UDP-glucose-4-epimerase GalE
MKTILVTGGAGYIGSHTCKLLHKQGYTPVVLDNLVYGHKEFVKWGPFEEGDINNPEVVEAVFRKYAPAAVIHFAAYAYVGESVADPAKYYRNNIGGTLCLLDAMRSNDCDTIVFSSSCATYGLPDTLPINEQHSQNPINPYGKSKLMVEEILKDYDLAYGIKSVSLRYFNAAGADLDGEIGEDHCPETHLIPLVIHSAMGGKSTVNLYGTDYSTEDGTAIRDYIHVADLADAHTRSIEFLVNDKRSDVFNLGTGNGYSVKAIINSVEQVTRQTVAVEYKDRRPGDPPMLVADASKAEDTLGWNARHSDLSNIISSAWEWHKRRHGTCKNP